MAAPWTKEHMAAYDIVVKAGQSAVIYGPPDTGKHTFLFHVQRALESLHDRTVVLVKDANVKTWPMPTVGKKETLILEPVPVLNQHTIPAGWRDENHQVILMADEVPAHVEHLLKAFTKITCIVFHDNPQDLLYKPEQKRRKIAVD